MSIRNLNYLFRPSSVAVIGASNRAHSVGHTVMRNLLEGGFDGPVMPVNPKCSAVAGVLAYPDMSSLPVTPDLAVVCTPAPTVPQIIRELGERGTKAAVVLTAGLSRQTDETGKTLQQAMLEAARPHLLRILGPNCVGVLVPGVSLNASFAHTTASSGRISVIHQSGALCTALLDWARLARHWLFPLHFAGRRGRCRFRRPARLLGKRSGQPRDSDVHRVYRACSQVHVGRPRGGPQQTGPRDQSRTI